MFCDHFYSFSNAVASSYNYVELAYFLAYVGKQHHRIFDAPRQGPATEQRISTEKIIRNIGEWLETEEGINAGGIKGIFERADKEILPLTAGNPVRLCNGCGEDILRVSQSPQQAGFLLLI